MVDRPGISFLRTTREKTPVIYPPGEAFPIGGSRVVRASSADRVTIVAAGITLHEAMKAADRLGGEGTATRVIDLYSIKPIDAETLRQAAADTAALVTVEDHWPEGGLGDAVLAVLAGEEDRPVVRHLAVRAMPGSATPAEQLADAGIDADAIVAAVNDLLKELPVAAAAGSGGTQP
jgi:transketolase